VFERVLSAALVPIMGAAVAVNPGTGVYVSMVCLILDLTERDDMRGDYLRGWDKRPVEVISKSITS